MGIINISSGNKALVFLNGRVNLADYRGVHLSQHNRYTMEKIIQILTSLSNYTTKNTLLTIRTTDISKRHENTLEEIEYAQFCDKAKGITGIGTQDAMRKNLFVDLHRMGFIERYNKHKNKIKPFDRECIKYVSLSELGSRLINETNILNRYFLYSKGLDILLGGYLSVILNLLRNSDYKLKFLDIHEVMFFISYFHKIGEQKIVELITDYRLLTPSQRQAVIEILKDEMDRRQYKDEIKGKGKKDFANWKNEVQQIYTLLSQSIYFEVREERLLLREKATKDILCEELEGITIKLDRSLSEKYNYFKNHAINKTAGFELHHVFPLSWAESLHHFKLLDCWQNMVYIDAFSHAKITQNGNRNVQMDTCEEDIILCDFSNNKVELKNKCNILYNLEHQKTMKEYNNQLLNTKTL
jgi:hypothetical protein